MWILPALATAALIVPHGCGPRTTAWAHYFPLATHNLRVVCYPAEAAAMPAVTAANNKIELWCHSDAECALMLASAVFQVNNSSKAELEALAASLDTTNAACASVADCPNATAFECVSVDNTTGYCAPTMPRGYKHPETPCFEGAHSTCNELIICSIGVAAGVLLSLGQLSLANQKVVDR